MILNTVLVIASVLTVGITLNCYDCTNLDDKDYCTNSRECTAEADVCYTLTATKSTGAVFYNLGCGMSDPAGCTCTEGIVCEGTLECCSGDNCNSEGTEEVETEPTEPPEVVEKTDEPDGANKNYTLDDTIDSDTDGSKSNNSTNSNTTRLEPEVEEGAATDENPSSALTLIPVSALTLIVLAFFC